MPGQLVEGLAYQATEFTLIPREDRGGARWVCEKGSDCIRVNDLGNAICWPSRGRELWKNITDVQALGDKTKATNT